MARHGHGAGPDHCGRARTVRHPAPERPQVQQQDRSGCARARTTACVRGTTLTDGSLVVVQSLWAGTRRVSWLWRLWRSPVCAVRCLPRCPFTNWSTRWPSTLYTSTRVRSNRTTARTRTHRTPHTHTAPSDGLYRMQRSAMRRSRCCSTWPSACRCSGRRSSNSSAASRRAFPTSIPSSSASPSPRCDQGSLSEGVSFHVD